MPVANWVDFQLLRSHTGVLAKAAIVSSLHNGSLHTYFVVAVRPNRGGKAHGVRLSGNTVHVTTLLADTPRLSR